MDQAWLAVLLSAFSIFPLWLIEQILPYPFLIEEVFKLLLVSYVVLRVRGDRVLRLILLCGLIFGLSETILYLFNVFRNSNEWMIVARLALTVPMHTLTFYVLYLGVSRGRVMTMICFGLALGIHWLFNLLRF